MVCLETIEKHCEGNGHQLIRAPQQLLELSQPLSIWAESSAVLVRDVFEQAHDFVHRIRHCARYQQVSVDTRVLHMCGNEK